MRIKITEDFRRSLRLWMEKDALTLVEAGKLIGVTHVTIRNWLLDAPKITSKHYSALEPYLNKFRDIKEVRNELHPLAEPRINQEGVFYVTKDNIKILQEHKLQNKLSYDQMAQRYHVPIKFLVNLLECQDDKIAINNSDALLFSTMTVKIIDHQNRVIKNVKEAN